MAFLSTGQCSRQICVDFDEQVRTASTSVSRFDRRVDRRDAVPMSVVEIRMRLHRGKIDDV